MTSTHIDVQTRIAGQLVTFTTRLYVTDCAECAVIFAIPDDLERRRRSDGRAFHCPNGHTLRFFESTEEKRIKELEATEKRLAEQLGAARRIAENEKRRRAAIKGQMTKMRNRYLAGMCPKPGCKRSFTSLTDHVRIEHPDLAEQLERILEHSHG